MYLKILKESIKKKTKSRDQRVKTIEFKKNIKNRSQYETGWIR